MLSVGETVCGYNTDDLLLDVGTPERLAWIEEHLKMLENPQIESDPLQNRSKGVNDFKNVIPEIT
jgi:NDP-sugar pyrophosphorylase family protein